MDSDPSHLDDELLAQAGRGDRSAIGRLIERHRGRLRKSLAGRIDRRISARLDASDLVQETFAVASRRLPEFVQERRIGFFDWLRGLAMDRLISARRFHLGASKRSAVKELPQAHRERDPVAGGALCAGPSPSGQAIHNEDSARIRSILDRMSPADREILDLRYVERLTFAQINARLGITQSAVKMRHLRAIERLRDVCGI
jgi:RNA polymerase sigma-70 factor, ECF subfamily